MSRTVSMMDATKLIHNKDSNRLVNIHANVT